MNKCKVFLIRLVLSIFFISMSPAFGKVRMGGADVQPDSVAGAQSEPDLAGGNSALPEYSQEEPDSPEDDASSSDDDQDNLL